VELICSDIALIFNGKLAAQGSLDSIFSTMQEVTIELEVRDSKAVLEFLEKSSLVQNIEVLSNAISLRILYGDIPQLVRELTARNIDIFSVSQRNRLENYFLSLMDKA
jgi:ABC-type multidrug transport system ATPase subunit